MGQLRVVGLIWTGVALVAWLVAAGVVPGWRAGARPWLWGYVALAVLFVVARTKTVSWRSVALVFAGSSLLAPLIGLADVAVAGVLGADINSQDGSVLVAGPVEETLKLLPLVAMLLLARRRAQSFAVADFLVLGFAAGLGFGVVEATIRDVTAGVSDQQPGLFTALATLGSSDQDLGVVQWGPWLPGWQRFEVPDVVEEAFFGGHGTTTALGAAGLGLGLRLRRRWGPGALLVPLALWAWVVLDHAMFNHVASGPEPLVAIDPHSVQPPDWLLGIWRGLGRGAAERPLLTALLAAGMVLDVRRSRSVEVQLPPVPEVGAAAWLRQRADRLATAAQEVVAHDAPRLLRRGASGVVETLRWVGHSLAEVTQDLVLTVLAPGGDLPAVLAFDHHPTGGRPHAETGEARGNPEPDPWSRTGPGGHVTTMLDARADAPAAPSRRRRWLVAVAYLRARRQLAQGLASQAERGGPRPGVASLGWAALAVALAAAVVAVLWAWHGDNPIEPFDPANPFGFLANLFDQLADWWDGLSFVEQILVVAALAGLLSFGLAPALGVTWGYSPTLGWIGAASLVPEYGHGLASLTRDPQAAVTGYVEGLTPQQTVLDAATAALEIPTRGHASSTGTLWRRQIDDIADAADASRRGRGTTTPASHIGAPTPRSGIPHGFTTMEDFTAFTGQLDSGLRAAGYDDATIVFQGSSVTGRSYGTGQSFDVGRRSDFDIAIVSSKAMSRAKTIGISPRSSGTRTGPLTSADLRKLGVSDLASSLSKQSNRPVHFMLFESTDAALARGPSIVVP